MAFTIEHQNETKALAERGVRIQYQVTNRGRNESYAVKTLHENNELFRNIDREVCVCWAMNLPVK